MGSTPSPTSRHQHPGELLSPSGWTDMVQGGLSPAVPPPSCAGTWFLPHSGCLMMFRTGLKQLSPVWSP